MIPWLGLVVACQQTDGPLPIRERSMQAEPSEVYLGPVTVSWEQPEAATVRVEYRVDGEWRATPDRDVAAGEVSMSVIGVPFGGAVPWRVVVDNASGHLVQDATSLILADPLPSSFPVLTVEVPDALERDDYVLTSVNENDCGWCSGPYWTFITDRAGQVVWATRTQRSEWTLFAQISVTGDHLIYDVVRTSDTSYAVRTYLDEPITTIDMPGHHHGFIELPDGTLAWARHQPGSVNETIAERAPGSDEIRTVWGCEDWPEVTGCRSNALEYDAERDEYWFSFYTLNAVVEVDRKTGDLLGFSDLRRPGEALDGEYLFDPTDSLFTWQHAPKVLPDGHLLISTDDVQRTTTKVAEYALDRDKGVFTEVWSFDPELRANYNGEVLRLANGDTMHGLGAAGVLYEVTPDGEVVWRMAFERGHQIGRVALVDDLYALVAPPAP